MYVLRVPAVLGTYKELLHFNNKKKTNDPVKRT